MCSLQPLHSHFVSGHELCEVGVSLFTVQQRCAYLVFGDDVTPRHALPGGEHKKMRVIVELTSSRVPCS